MKIRKEPRIITFKEPIIFPAAHYIPQQGGKCEGIHGHNYFVWDLTITIHNRTNVTLDNKGMIVDFGIIKDYFKQNWDHKFIIPEDDTQFWESIMSKGIVLNNLKPIKHTTAEYMAMVMQEELQELVSKYYLEEESDRRSWFDAVSVRFTLSEGPVQGITI
jgi:6-pyruvoyl-tetrahydropterin synthase